MLTTHIRARYVVNKVVPDRVQSGSQGTMGGHQATVQLQHKLANLFQQYMKQKGLQRE